MEDYSRTENRNVLLLTLVDQKVMPYREERDLNGMYENSGFYSLLRLEGKIRLPDDPKRREERRQTGSDCGETGEIPFAIATKR